MITQRGEQPVPSAVRITEKDGILEIVLDRPKANETGAPTGS